MKYILSILTLFICLTITAQKGPFPKLEGHTLEGTAITIPIADTKKFTIVGICYKRSAEEDLKTWIQPMYDESGKIKFVLGISRDITKEKIAQIELEQRWNNYKNLLDTSPIGIFIHEGYCIYGNKTAAQILEVKDPKKLIGKYLIEFIIPEQRQQAIDRMQRAIKGEELSDRSYKITTSKGNIIDVDLRTAPFVYNGKTVVQTTITNISAEKKLQREKLRAEVAEESNKKLKEEINYRQKIQHELVTQTTKYEAIFNNTSHLIWTVDRNYFFTSFNQNFADNMFNVYGVKPTLDKKVYKPQTTKVGKAYHQWWITKYDEVFKKATSIEFATEQLDSNEKKLYRQIFIHPILKNGEVEEISCISNDVTELRYLQDQSINQVAKLNSIFESSSHLIWTVDKEFKATSFNKNFSNVFKLYNKIDPFFNKTQTPSMSTGISAPLACGGYY